jgi:hypothetical protein
MGGREVGGGFERSGGWSFAPPKFAPLRLDGQEKGPLGSGPDVKGADGARDRTRTYTGLPPLEPESNGGTISH